MMVQACDDNGVGQNVSFRQKRKVAAAQRARLVGDVHRIFEQPVCGKRVGQNGAVQQLHVGEGMGAVNGERAVRYDDGLVIEIAVVDADESVVGECCRSGG